MYIARKRGVGEAAPGALIEPGSTSYWFVFGAICIGMVIAGNIFGVKRR
jgi:hypothetical protein